MESLGTELKEAREKQHVSLRQIAEETHISLRHLENLEMGHYNDLPGGMYNRAFLRAYCQYLGLDLKKIMERYEAEVTPPSEKVTKTKARSFDELALMDRRLNPIAVWSLLLLVSIAGLYFTRRWITAVFSPYFSEPLAPSLSTESRPLPESPKVLQATSPAPTSVAEGGPGRPTIKPDQLTARPGTIRLEIQVVEQCWVDLNSDGNRILVRLLEPGEDQSFDATDRFYIVIGNAGGVRLKINGRPVRSLGGTGQVVRMLINDHNIKDFLEPKIPG